MLIHGDCLIELRKLPSRSVDLICTDPPYGDNAVYGRDGRTIVGNATPVLGFYALEEALRLLKMHRFAIVFLGQKHLPFFDHYIRTYCTARLRGYVVWNKTRMGLGYGVRPQHELIAILEKGKPPYRDKNVPSVLSFPRVYSEQHPHKKPAELIEYLIEKFSTPRQIVLDPFLGSGTTAIAAEKLNRRWIGIEIDDQYVAVTRAALTTCAVDPAPVGRLRRMTGWLFGNPDAVTVRAAGSVVPPQNPQKPGA